MSISVETSTSSADTFRLLSSNVIGLAKLENIFKSYSDHMYTHNMQTNREVHLYIPQQHLYNACSM